MEVFIAVLLVLFFSLASSVKILGWQKKVFEIQLEFFRKYGLNRQVMLLVGVIESLGSVLMGVGIATNQYAWGLIVGAVLIAVTSVGAIYFHLRYDTWRDGVPAMITAVLSSYLILA